MTVATGAPVTAAATAGIGVAAAAALPADAVLRDLGSSTAGIGSAEARLRLARCGPNAVRTSEVRPLAVLGRQLRSPLLLLLALTAVVSAFLREAGDAVILGIILVASTGLGFVNEYRAERAAAALHDQVRHTCVLVRDGRPEQVDVVDLVPGDVVDLRLGEVVPADLRLLATAGLACDESVLTGESAPVVKGLAPVGPGAPLAELTCCALMGTIVHAGSGRGVVVSTADRTEFGRIARGLAEREPESAFQVGLTQFSRLLVQVAAVLTTGILVVNVALHRPLIDAVLFSLAIAVGISPQLLPAVVATSLATGSRALARRHVLVKRLVGIEDLGNVDVLLTDKTGTLTDGRISFMRAVGADGMPDAEPLCSGWLCTEATVADTVAGGNALDVALWQAPTATVLRPAAESWRRIAHPAVRPRPAAGVGARRERRHGPDAPSPRVHRRPSSAVRRACLTPSAGRRARVRRRQPGRRGRRPSVPR